MTTEEMINFLDEQVQILATRHNSCLGHIHGGVSKEEVYKNSKEGRHYAIIIATLRAAGEIVDRCEDYNLHTEVSPFILEAVREYRGVSSASPD